MTDSDLVAAFLAKKAITVVPVGARATTDAQMKRAIGYTPDKEYKWEVFAQGEDGGHFTEVVLASTKAIAEEKFEEQYPESSVITVEHYGAHQERAYQRVHSQMTNDDDMSDYDY